MPQTLKGHLCGFAQQNAIPPGWMCMSTCKNSSFCTVLRNKNAILPGRIFIYVAHASPAHLIGSPNPLVSRGPQTQGAEQGPGIPTGLRNASKPFFSQFFRSIRIRQFQLECYQSFFCAKTGPTEVPWTQGGRVVPKKKSFSKEAARPLDPDRSSPGR